MLWAMNGKDGLVAVTNGSHLGLSTYLTLHCVKRHGDTPAVGLSIVGVGTYV